MSDLSLNRVHAGVRSFCPETIPYSQFCHEILGIGRSAFELVSQLPHIDKNEPLAESKRGGVALTNEAPRRPPHAYCRDPLLYSSGKLSAMIKCHDRFSSRRIEGPDQGKNQHVLRRRQADHPRCDFVPLKEAAS